MLGFEDLGAEIEVKREGDRESCSEVERRNSCRLIWCVNQRLVRGESCCEEKRRTEYAVSVKRPLSGLLCGLVCRQRKESCKEKRRTE